MGVMHGRDAWAMSLIEYGFWIDKKSPKAEDRSRAVACGGGGGGVMRVRAIHWLTTTTTVLGTLAVA